MKAKTKIACKLQLVEIEGEKWEYILILRGNQITLADMGDVRNNERGEQEQRVPRFPSPVSQQVKEREILN